MRSQLILMQSCRHGIGKVMDMALGWIGTDTPIHLSFDVDALVRILDSK